MTQPAIIFDLDMTLLDTSALQAARDQHNWAYVAANLHLARPFAFTHPPHQLPNILHAKGYPVGVVTSSPRWYAQALLKNFGVHHDVLVAYEDTQNHKPDPAPLQEALQRLKVSAVDAYYVGDAKEDFAASYHAHIRSIGAAWNPAVPGLWRMAPDILLYNPYHLQDPSLLPRLGYIAEVQAAHLAPLIHPGSVLLCGSPAQVALGRYFTSKDRRHTDPLTARVLELKRDDAPSAIFGAALAGYLIHGQVSRPTFVTCVPPKPSQQGRIRFEKTLLAMKTYVSDVGVVPDGLYATREVEDYKLTNRDARAALIAGAFASKYQSWNKQNVLLLDDVFTSGATTDECTRVLAASQAANVHTVCLSVDQDPFELKRCSYCGRLMKHRVRKSDKRPFWGCSGWRRDGTGCRHTEDAA